MHGGDYGGGIVNRGNTCYISASLQVLLRFKPFHELITEVSHAFSDVEFFVALANMSRKLENAKDVVSPDSIIAVLGIDPSKQFDVCEFMTNLLNRILDITSNPKVGLLFYCYFAKLDDPGNVLFCGCRIVENASIADVLAQSEGMSCSLPELLLIQLDRIKYDAETNELVKDSRVMRTNRRMVIGGTAYYLYAIIEHMGKPDHGHYVAYVKDSEGWLKCNDSRVTKCEWQDVITSSQSEHSPVYVAAYVKSFDQVRTLRTCAVELAFGDVEENVHFRLFDAASMSIIDKADLPLDDARTIKETTHHIMEMWTEKHGRLGVRYKVNKGAPQWDFPALSNFKQADLLVWFERANGLRLFDPVLVLNEPIVVTYRIYKISNFEVPMKFYPTTNVRKVARYARTLVDAVAGENDRRSVSVYIQVQKKFVRLAEKKKIQQNVFECQAMLGGITILINMHPMRPLNVVFYTLECYESGVTLNKRFVAKRRVEYHQTFSDLVADARSQLRMESVAIYSVSKDGIMTRLREDSMPLYRIAMEHPMLRAENLPKQNSYNFIVVDRRGDYGSLCGMLDIRKNETVEMLERRAEQFFDIPNMKLTFKTASGVSFRPQNPYDEMPKSEGFIVVCRA